MQASSGSAGITRRHKGSVGIGALNSAETHLCETGFDVVDAHELLNRLLAPGKNPTSQSAPNPVLRGESSWFVSIHAHRAVVDWDHVFPGSSSSVAATKSTFDSAIASHILGIENHV